MEHRIAFLLSILIAGIVGLFTSSARAEGLVYKAEGSNGQPAALRLFDKPCTDAKVEAVLNDNVRDEYVPQFKAATLTWAGNDYAACYLILQERVFALDEEGAPFNPPHGVPLSLFKDDAI